MATLSVPSPQPVSTSFGANRRQLHRPLSTHGMPKEPRTLSPERPHRFSALGFPSQSFRSDSMSPRSPGPMSPPMSAKSFGTFIDSEPSTPAYSPRMDDDWDNSTLVLLRPTSSSSEPSSPTEPIWDMMMPMKLPHKPTTTTARTKGPSVAPKEVSTGTSPYSHPVKQAKVVRPLKEIKVADLSQKENQYPRKMDVDDSTKDKSQDEHDNNASNASAAPLGKLATKMRLMLRRRSTNDKKKQKKEKDYYEVDHMDDVHWTEM